VLLFQPCSRGPKARAQKRLVRGADSREKSAAALGDTEDILDDLALIYQADATQAGYVLDVLFELQGDLQDLLDSCDPIQSMLDAIQQAEDDTGVGLGLFGNTDTAQMNLDSIRAEVQAQLDDVNADIFDVMFPPPANNAGGN
jgi:hypothetical protein